MFLSSGVGGKDGDGDIFNEHNLEAFKEFVMDSTDGKGVHFVMADGVRTTSLNLLNSDIKSQFNGRTDRRTDRWMDGRREGWRDRWTD